MQITAAFTLYVIIVSASHIGKPLACKNRWGCVMSTTSATACGPQANSFELQCQSPAQLQRILHTDPYSAAGAFVRGEFSVAGDLVAAVRRQLGSGSQTMRTRLFNLAARVAPWRLMQRCEQRLRTRRNIQFHYDRSNAFYAIFLDRRMVYSCAYFPSTSSTLDDAQLAKLDHVCRKLRLHPGEQFLDIGCGWGALTVHASRRFGVFSTGCTLSPHQAAYARQAVDDALLHPFVRIVEQDYRDTPGSFDKIASVGMVEHVGLARLRQYFRKVNCILRPDGLFLNHGITMPASAHHDAQGLFIARYVFPGGEIVRLSDMITAAEKEGFAVLDVESLRAHYSMTCRAWLERLRSNETIALALVDEQTLRTWEIYLAGCVVAFEDGGLDIHQILLGKQGRQNTPLTRNDIYAGCYSG
ncbi:MAG: class I SAM-dependent methyltransferase [Bryobacterales bacterium]|nr:class I SAM-dependent methyltransferase [Bryobacterales bacterium]